MSSHHWTYFHLNEFAHIFLLISEIVLLFAEINSPQQADITKTLQLIYSCKALLILPAFIMYLIVWGK